MAVEDMIQHPDLKLCMKTANATLSQTLAIIDILSTAAQTPTTIALQTQVAKNQKILSGYLSRLRSQTRRGSYLCRASKTQTAEVRKEVDALLLQLQNLYYEQRHLRGEIASCEEYAHAFRELPLINDYEYLDMFPECQDMNESELMERRIAFEDEERKRMDEERKELVKRKEALVVENARRKEAMKKMDEKLESWVEGLSGLEEDLSKDL